MYPGAIGRISEKKIASAASIIADVDCLILTGATGIENIRVSTPTLSAQIVYLIPITGSIVLGVTGNIAVAQTLIVNKVTAMIYSSLQGKWYPHALA